ncbi:MAG TPA: biopolymer transporter ExbD [Planctomycetota bacterium]
MAKKREMPEEIATEQLNMTPMIDVVFQLLIFFMLTMQFKEIEGKLLSQLPKDKGLAPSHVLQPELQEVRIVLCAGGDTRMHLHDKGKHEKSDKDNSTCKAMVEKIDIGDLFLSEKHGKVAHNKQVYTALAEKTKALVDAQPSAKDPTKKAPVILDADSETPYEHIIGAVDACKNVGIDNVEFVGNPRHDKYYGSMQKGQFERNKK